MGRELGRAARTDAVVVAGCAALALAFLALAGVLGDPAVVVPGAGTTAWWATAGLLVAQAAALPLVRVRPRESLVGLALVAPVVALAGGGDATSITSLAVAVAVFSAVARLGSRALTPPLVAVGALMVAGGVVAAHGYGVALPTALGAAVLQYAGTLALTLIAASWVRAQREVRTARAGEQDALLRAAVARERAEMARELHDIAAHHLSAIAVLASAVERQVDTDPGGAKVAVGQVREQSTAVLRDLRRLVGLLRDGPADDPRPETLAGLGALVADAATAGLDVRLDVDGDAVALGHGVRPLAQLAAYRAVQEALTNVVRHAPGASCTVTVAAPDEDAVVVTVRNGPAARAPRAPGRTARTGRAGPGGGYGLLGMRERAQLTGGTVETGPTSDGGWAVVLRLPREPAEATSAGAPSAGTGAR